MLHRKHVLVVGERNATRKTLRNYLQKLGNPTVQYADSLSQALEALDGTRVDLLICDMDTFEPPGVEAVQALRERFNGKAPPILGITSEYDREALLKMIQSGLNAMLLKPFSEASLEKQLARFFPHARPASPADIFARRI